MERILEQKTPEELRLTEAELKELEKARSMPIVLMQTAQRLLRREHKNLEE